MPTRTTPTATRTTAAATRTTPTLTPTTATSARAALARCVEPAEPEAFLGEYWERAPFHAAREDGDVFDDLLTREEAERLVAATGLRTPGFRLVKAGETISGYAASVPW